MTNKKYYVVLAVIMMYLSLLSCSDLKIGVGLKGVILDENKITLDGDTFDIRERIGDSLLIVWNYTHSNDRTPCYLLKYERNGFYYPQIGGTDITSIDNTTDFVSIDDKEVYDIKVTMFANANAMTTVGRRSLEALRLQPLGKPPQCFS